MFEVSTFESNLQYVSPGSDNQQLLTKRTTALREVGLLGCSDLKITRKQTRDLKPRNLTV